MGIEDPLWFRLSNIISNNSSFKLGLHKRKRYYPTIFIDGDYSV